MGPRDMHRPFVSIVGSCIISVSIGNLLAMASAYVFRAPSSSKKSSSRSTAAPKCFALYRKSGISEGSQKVAGE